MKVNEKVKWLMGCKCRKKRHKMGRVSKKQKEASERAQVPVLMPLSLFNP
jgi:hypothetical protein